MKRPGDEEPEPPGGRAAERLKKFQQERLPADAPSEKAANKSELEDKPETNGSPSGKDREPGR